MEYEVFVVGTEDSFCLRETFQWTYGELRYSLVPGILTAGLQLKCLYVLPRNQIDVDDAEIPAWYSQDTYESTNALFRDHKGIVLMPNNSYPKEFSELMNRADLFLWAMMEHTNGSQYALFDPIAAPPSCH